MKILYLNYSADILQKMRIEDVSRGIEAQGHQVIVEHMHPKIASIIKDAEKKKKDAYASTKPGFSSRLPNNRWLLITMGEIKRFLGNLYYITKEFKLIRKHKPDFILTRLMPMWSIFLSSFLLRQKMVLDTDGPLKEMFSYEVINIPRFYLKLEKFFIRKSKAISVISTRMKEFYASFGGDPNRIFISPNGINGDEFKPDLDASEVINEYNLHGKTIVGFMGNLAPWHGLPGLLNQFPALAAKYSDVVLLMVGFNLDWDNLPASVSRELIKVKDRVICTGRIPFQSMPSHLKAIDIFVLPYPYMDFFYFSPVKLFESMGVGCADVAAGIGQIAEVIEDGEDGLLFPAGDYETMRRKIEELIRNPELRKKLGEAAARKIHSHYLWKQTTKGMIDAYYYAYGESHK